MKKLSTPQGSHVPVSLTDVTEERGEEVEAPLQDAEWDHSKVVKTEVQQNSNCYNFQDQWVEEDQTPTSTKQAPRKQQVLRYLNIKFYATPILSSTLPQYQVLRYPNIKIQNVWTRHQAWQRDDLNLRGLETIVHKHYTTLHYTLTSSSTLPQPKRKMQEEKKRMQVNQDMAVRMRTKITRISPSRRRTVPASLRTSPPSATATACPATPRCQKTNTKKK